MPALYPGLDKPSRPMEGYPPAGPPPQLPAANKHRESCSQITGDKYMVLLENAFSS